MADRAHIHAVIGVWWDVDPRRCLKPRAYYLKRSLLRPTYPGVWGLLAASYQPDELPDRFDTTQVQALFDRMAAERLGGFPFRVDRWITGGRAPLPAAAVNGEVVGAPEAGCMVELQLYRVSGPLDTRPQLNSEFYVDSAWLTGSEYAQRARDSLHGLCTYLWHRWARPRFLSDFSYPTDPAVELLP